MRRRIMTYMASALGILLFCQCGSMRISYRRLPERSRSFIETYFPMTDCLRAERERDDGRKEYEVKLANGTKLEFDSYGEWKKIDCGYSFLPEGILPPAIVTDVASRCGDARIYKAERARGGYKVKSGNMELIYSSDGSFVRTDY